MITKWKISNFKSIRETVELSLAPLTIFCGPNSSGKSAFMKSILMAAQSLSSSAWEEPLVLNGPFLDLGPLEDLLHHDCSTSQMELGFTLQMRSGEQITVSSQIIGEQPKVARIAGRLKAKVSNSEIKMLSSNGDERIIRLKWQPIRRELDELNQTAPILRGQVENGVFDYQITDPTYAELVTNPEFATVLSASLHNFLPGRLLLRIHTEVRQAVVELRQLTTLIQNMANGWLNRKDHGSVSWNTEISEVTRQALGVLLSRLTRQTRSDPYFELLEDIIESSKLNLGQCFDLIARRVLAGRLQERELPDLARRLAGTQTDLVRVAGKMRGRERIELESGSFPAQYTQGIAFVRDQLGRHVFYLGPLRDDPHVIYSIPSFPHQRDVGLKGEYTAAMIETFGSQEDVDYPVPPDQALQFSGRYAVKRGKLLEAVEVWLRRMGLGEGIDTVETAKVGYRLNLRDSSLGRDLDLTNVGVGVSQVLPSLVMALLAPPGSILIFEQPEVHLHPKVQSVLGDFLLGIVATGKQCLVETHSEHVINRIRRRIAEAPDTTILNRTHIYFVERENSVSKYRLIKPNEYGAILEWPQGFFDEVETESGHILEAAVQKRQEVRKQALQGREE
ncbi:MAG TPA: DUF3696 domain-containing protein [Chloroflexia bacterium]|nr:DUF3696 domain-containing protein [Chloroflexia bacterium]